MRLDVYLTREGISEPELAYRASKHLGRRLASATINRLRHGNRTASLPVALAIEAACEGRVRAEEIPLSSENLAILALVRRGQAASEERVA